MVATEIHVFPTVDKINLSDREVKKQATAIVIEALRDYRSIKVKMENQIEQIEAGLTGLFRKVKDEDVIDSLKVRQVDRALHRSLDGIERKIIEMKYLDPDEKNDITIYLELGIRKGTFYEKKKSAIDNIAKSLGVI